LIFEENSEFFRELSSEFRKFQKSRLGGLDLHTSKPQLAKHVQFMQNFSFLALAQTDKDQIFTFFQENFRTHLKKASFIKI
jgi:hypothetical protein